MLAQVQVSTPHMLAILNNTALGLFARQGETNLPHAQRVFPINLTAHWLAWSVKGAKKLCNSPGQGQSDPGFFL